MSDVDPVPAGDGCCSLVATNAIGLCGSRTSRYLEMTMRIASIMLGLSDVLGIAVAHPTNTPVPEDGQCNFVNYRHDEARNGQGSGVCTTDCDCDGMRSCVSGTCTGTARPEKLTAKTCNNPDY